MIDTASGSAIEPNDTTKTVFFEVSRKSGGSIFGVDPIRFVDLSGARRLFRLAIKLRR
jgi:hypothetical protein